jgi:hypothetical protein
VAGLSVALILLGSLLASSAAAKVVYDPVIHKSLGILTPPTALAPANAPLSAATPLGASGTPTCNGSFEKQCATLLTNPGGGPVQHAEKDYLLFWGPSGSFPASYVHGMQSFLSGLAASDYGTGHTAPAVGNPLSVVQQYYDNSGPLGAKRFVPLAIQNAGTIMDTDPYPNAGQNCTDAAYSGSSECVTATNIQNEVTSYISKHHYPSGIDVEYFVFTPQGVGSCDDSTSTTCAMSDYCAWHTYDPFASDTTFADMPWSAGTPCDLPIPLVNDETGAVAGSFSHELAETMTDPTLRSWKGKGGGSDEIGDKCAYEYVVGDSNLLDTTGLPQAPGGAAYNTRLSGHDYLLQMEFDNSANAGTGGCDQWDIDTQPTAAISLPGAPSAGKAARFSLARVSAPAGIAYVSWNFGDGRTGTSIGTAPVFHVYHAAGTRTVTAIVTDNHGNEVKKTKMVQVLVPAPPGTRITTAHIHAGARSATFAFTGSAGVGALHFQCKLDSGSWSSCRSPKTYHGLRRGSHRFQVRALDARGKADRTPAKRSFGI